MIDPVPRAARSDAASRRPGRPRDARVDQTILAAAAAVLSECGPAGFSVDAVAARAGVGKATIYRRWPSRADLLIETAHLATPDLPDPDTGSLREDLVSIYTGLMGKMRDTTAGRVLPAVIAEVAVNPEMRASFDRFIANRRDRVIRAVRAGIERGELPPTTDVELLVDLASGPVFVRTLITRGPIDEAMVRRVVDIILDGARHL